MTYELFITNLADTVMEGELRALFSEDGRRVTEVSVVVDRVTGKSRGFGFVELMSTDEAAAAVAALNGREVSGRSIVVRESRPRG
jgi:cold-inducible RNA-binding protein